MIMSHLTKVIHIHTLGSLIFILAVVASCVATHLPRASFLYQDTIWNWQISEEAAWIKQPY